MTAGLRHEVQDIRKARVRLHPLLLRNADVTFGVGLVLFGVCFVGLPLYFKAQTAAWSGSRARVRLRSGSGARTSLLEWRPPTLELLADGQPPSYQRLRARILAVTGAIVLGVAASIIAAPLT